MSKREKNRLIYIITTLIPTIMLMVTLAAFIIPVLNGGKFEEFNWKLIGILGVCTYVISKICTKFRVDARQIFESENEETNPTFGYKYKSKKERMAIDMMTYQANEAALSEKEFRGMIHEGSKDPDKDLENLSGMDEIKEKILEYKAQMLYGKKKEPKSLNMCFIGNPGTGKTTVAGIVAGYLNKYKILKSNEYVVVDGATLISSSDPSRRINLLLKRSKNKVLFIDEAYSLALDTGVGGTVLAIILNEMENDRQHTVVIFAGYKKEMRALFLLNSGLESRIGTFLFFKDYDSEELLLILINMLRKRGFEIEDEALYKSLDILEELKRTGTFANARSMRNICESAISKHRYRYMQKLSSEKSLIEVDDINLQESKNNYFSDVNF